MKILIALVLVASLILGGALVAGGCQPREAPGASPSSLIPTVNNTYDLGMNALRWRNAYVTSLVAASSINSTHLIDSSLTSGRVVTVTTGGQLADSASLTFDGSKLTVTSANVTTLISIVKMIATGQYASTSYAASVSIDWNNGNVQYLTLASGAQVITMTNPVSGGRYILDLRQPSSGAAGTVTWPSTVKWPSGTAPTLTTTNNSTDEIALVYFSDNTSYRAGSSLDIR